MGNHVIKYKSYSVIGAARSGVAAAKLLKSKGYEVFLSDINPQNKIKDEFVREITESGIDAEFGKHSDRVFESDVIVVSPGVPQNSEVIVKSISLGKKIISELELASWFCKGKIIAITGTNGKTTTTTMIGKIFEDAGYKAFVCGNIGIAFSDVVEKIGQNDVAVVETSSFQLDNIDTFKPYISILLNITPDHLDRYDKSLNNYILSKLRMAENQGEKDYLVYNHDDEVVKNKLKEKIKAKLIPFSTKYALFSNFDTGAYWSNGAIVYFSNSGQENIINTKNLIIKGQHNIYNTMASVITAKIFDIKRNSIEKTLLEFRGVEHRLEFVRELNGVKFYNDSKATNVNSVWYAIQGFSEPIILILGGRDKGNDYTEIEKEVKRNVRHIIALGESKQKVYEFFNGKVPVTIANSLEDAVMKAYSNSQKNNIVLLSPACASFDMFENYEHRGKEFKRIVNEL
jgi:UDP-N-acetylmuramoylalanine--D-glutamate ligase